MSTSRSSIAIPSLTFSQLERSRWNVLDLITVVSKGSVPVTLLCDVDMSWVEELRKTYKERKIRITETAILLKAIGIAQESCPQSRSLMLPFGRIAVLEKICAGFTVEKFVDGKPSVFFGSIQEPQNKSLESIMDELKSFAAEPISTQPQLSRENSFSKMPWLLRQVICRLAMLVPEVRSQLLNASFGVSSLGKYGVSAVTGPCVCTSTFGVGAVEKRAVIKDEQILSIPTMTLTLLFDQRCLDGGNAARFLAEVKRLLEGELGKHL